jgi:8-hydroxy-5-deazaflavin:NADPH oxidoreductase
MRFNSRSYLSSLGAALLFISSAVSVNAYAETFAIIGTGDVGSALGKRFTQLGHTVVYGSRDPSRASVRTLVAETGGGATAATPAEAVVDADIVVLAVPWNAVESIVAGLGDLSGKIIIDPTNPRISAADGLYDPPLATSNTAMIQAWAPDADVVKALTIIPAESMLDPDLVDYQFVLPIAGDSTQAKAWVSELLNSMGIEVVDFGKARHAHIIEALYSASRNMRVQGAPARITFDVLP